MTPRDLSHSDRIHWLRLARTPRIGPVNFHRLVSRYGSAAAALDALPGLARDRGMPPPRLPDPDLIKRELETTHAAGFRIIESCSPAYPPALTCIADPPPVLVTRGRVDLMHRPACAIVGARNASAAGLRFARELASGLSAEDIIITSGLARGIDGAAHQGALAGGTIAVLAGGPDHVYPPEHNDLYARIAETGLIVSEMPLGFSPTARDFPRRNRLVSGLSLGTLVVEAATRSGSLITARLANEQGRDVMAIPGSPIDPRAQGCNQLLKDGAHLVQGVEDILDILARAQCPQRGDPASRNVREYAVDEIDLAPEIDGADVDRPDDIEAKPSPEAGKTWSPSERLLDLVSPTPVSIDELARQSGLPPGVVASTMMELEMSGAVTHLPGGLIQSR